jgi:hypothetical protein
MKLAIALVIPAFALGCIGQAPIGDEESAASTVQQGVDRAGAFTPTEAVNLKKMYTSPPLTFTGVYIGGPCNAGSWNLTQVQDIYNATKWGFLPIYVGQQSAVICPGHTNLTAAQGTIDGKAALADLKAFQWNPGLHIPCALDLESGAYDSDNAGAVAYANAWAAAVAAGGYDPYVYSSVNALNAIAAAGSAVVGAWPAHWFKNSGLGTYMPNLDPANVPNLSAHWTLRGWQYNSGPATDGTLVDFDAANFTMAPAPGTTALPAPS